MARVTYVKKAQKSKKERTCGACREPIEAGQAYRWAAPGGIGARKLFRHATETCNKQFTRSDLSSSKMGTVWDAQDSADLNFDAESYITVADDGSREFDEDAFMADVNAVLQDVASAAEECASDYQDGIDSMPDALQDGPTAEESREKVDALESYQQELESFSTSASFDAPEREDRSDDIDEGEDDDVYANAFAGAVEEFIDEVVGEAQDIIDQFDY